MAEKFHILGAGGKRPIKESEPKKKRTRPSQLGKRCTVCNHHDRILIEIQLANGGSSLRGLGKQFNLNYKSIENHLHNHVTAARLAHLRLVNPLGKADMLADLSAEAGKSALENLRAVHQGVISRWLNALESKSDQFFIALTAQARQNIELLAKLSKELQPAQTNVNIGVQANIGAFERPEYIDAIATITAALRPFPEARAAVSEALRSLEIAQGGAKLIEGEARRIATKPV